MKKEYKLIKEYPGSGLLGRVITLESCGIFPEFWEEVIENNYQILEYRTEGGNSCKAPFLQGSHQFYIDERCKIHSVKRLSDGEIFTIGDRITATNNIYYDGYKMTNRMSGAWRPDFTNTQIHSFELTEGKLVATFSASNFTPKAGQLIEHVEKVQKMLLAKTIDGVDIYEGDEFYCLSGNDIEKLTARVIEYEEKLIFSTRDLAQEHIVLNTICLSLKDVKTILRSRTEVRSKLRALVEERLIK